MTRSADRDPLTIQEKLDAQAAGRAAALAGLHPGTNPHRLSDVLDQDPDRVAKLQLMWVRGYQQARAEIEAARPTRTPPDD